ncbi:MAG: carbohydrate ABC transporter permease [Bacillota bacterium]|nr:MAG: thiamine ABC transporter ATP-binding protein [Bacillota bacterium]
MDSTRAVRKPRVDVGTWLRVLICSLVALVVLVPLVSTAINGLKSHGQLMADPFGLPSPAHWSNYQSVLTNSRFWQQLTNSTIVTLATVALTLLVASMAAFVLARYEFAGRKFTFNLFILGMLFPTSVAMLPLYILIRQLGLIDSHWGVILPQVAFGLPVSILILRDYFRGIPVELEEAAVIDGCSPFTFFWRILLPLSRPALAAVAVLSMVGSWNAFLLPLLVLNDRDTWTLPLGVMQFQGQYTTDWALVMAFVTVSMLPAILFFLVAERHLIAGLTAGSVKG